MRKPAPVYIPACDIGVLIATSPVLQGLARRNSNRPCRPWIRFTAPSDAHSTAKEPAAPQQRLATFCRPHAAPRITRWTSPQP
ncbi:MAG: hypothetical protein DI560_14545 [Pseudomonas putida]|nr:MAG: hypothetical protein DI560_14545 [Pseudomonas putida]